MDAPPVLPPQAPPSPSGGGRVSALSPPAPPMPPSIPTTSTGILPIKMDKPVYSSPPPAPSNPENNTCKMIEYRGAKVAAFQVEGRELICLPQAFELFLKHLVGGLHTVYTKLKRLDIIPIVCNVEQVRILRGLGAIQPGVNRCKLISPKEFDILYDDCTNSSARPGRPPKRSPLAPATPETLEKLKKSRLDGPEGYPYGASRLLDPKKSPLFGNGYHYPPHLASMSMPFLPMTHPMMNMAMANHMGLRPEGSIINHSRAVEEMARKSMMNTMAVASLMSMQQAESKATNTGPHATDLSQRNKEESRYEEGMRSLEHNNNKPVDKPLNLQIDRQMDRRDNGDKESGLSTPSEIMSNGQLDLSMKGHMTHDRRDDDINDDDVSDEDDKEEDLDDEMDSSDVPSSVPNGENGENKMPTPSLQSYSAQMLSAEATGISSVETLLMNIQGLLKVASENARHRERQINYEKAELKMDLMREREIRESIEKQLMDEQRNKILLQKRLKKEKKARRKLHDQLESLGQTAMTGSGDEGSTPAKLITPTSTAPENLRLMSDSLSQDSDRDHRSECSDSDRRMPPVSVSDSHSGLQNLMETFLGSQKACNGTPNGYLSHPPVIKQAESV